MLQHLVNRGEVEFNLLFRTSMASAFNIIFLLYNKKNK